jgi:biotin transport system permease protein
MSVLHRAPAGAKLLVLAAFTSALVVWASPTVVVGAAALVALMYAVARLGPSALWEVLRPLRWFVVVLAAYQVWAVGWAGAVVVGGTLVVAVAAAGLVTLTTTTTAMLETVVRALAPLRRVGVDPERVGLAFSLAVRSIPVLHRMVQEALDARKARGKERSMRAVVTPVVVRTVRYAERTGEALAARGYDD